MRRVSSLVIVAALVSGPLDGFRRAHAQGGIPNCADLPNPVYMVGTTAVEPLVRRFGAKLNQIQQTLLWNQNTDGCSSVSTMAFSSGSAGGSAISSVFNYYQEVPVDGGTKIVTFACNALRSDIGDLAINDIFWTSCYQSYGAGGVTFQSLPSGFKEFLGPVQGLVPVVASSFLYYDLMAEEAQDLYVCGGGYVLTFNSNTFIYDYNCISSGMRELWANSLGLRGNQFTTLIGLGCSTTQTATDVLNAVASTGSPDATIGYTSTEVYDENRDKVHALKFRGVGQQLAYLPDTDISSHDKVNIREGRYTAQGALKLVARVDANGVPTNAAAKKMIDWLQDNPVSDPSLQLPFSIVDIYAQSGVVPQCAMKVTKDSDAPAFRPYQPDRPCNCYFQVKATGQSIAQCVPCQTSASCAAGQVCSYGYCE